MAATFGVLLGAPTLKLRGDYLAIVTLGFGEIVPITLMNADKFTDGVNGIGGIDKPNIPGILQFTLINPWPMYGLVVVLFTLIMIMIYRLEDSRLGRTWDAIREDELAAESSGVNIVIAKLQAFAVGASIAGIVGVVLALAIGGGWLPLTLLGLGLAPLDSAYGSAEWRLLCAVACPGLVAGGLHLHGKLRFAH